MNTLHSSKLFLPAMKIMSQSINFFFREILSKKWNRNDEIAQWLGSLADLEVDTDPATYNWQSMAPVLTSESTWHPSGINMQNTHTHKNKRHF